MAVDHSYVVMMAALEPNSSRHAGEAPSDRGLEQHLPGVEQPLVQPLIRWLAVLQPCSVCCAVGAARVMACRSPVLLPVPLLLLLPPLVKDFSRSVQDNSG